MCSAGICRHVPAACAGISEPLQLRQSAAEEHVRCDRWLFRPDRLLADAWDWPQLPHAQYGEVPRAAYHQKDRTGIWCSATRGSGVFWICICVQIMMLRLLTSPISCASLLWSALVCIALVSFDMTDPAQLHPTQLCQQEVPFSEASKGTTCVTALTASMLHYMSP